MPAITFANLGQLDLNLLLVLHAVLAEGSVTQAARRLRVTQSAVSNSLARLRQLFADPLVVRNGRGIVATPLALSLAPALAQALEQLAHLLGAGQRFDAQTDARCFTLACDDAAESHDAPLLFQLMRQRLPRAHLRVVSLDYLLAQDGLASGSVDLALGPPVVTQPEQHYRRLYAQDIVMVARRDHPLVRGRVSRKLFNQLQYIDVLLTQGRTGSGGTAAGKHFAEQGLTRNVALSVSHFGAAALAASRTDCVTLLPERTARLYSELAGLRIASLPMPLRMEMGMIWHARTDADPAHDFFRGVVSAALGEPTRRARS